MPSYTPVTAVLRGLEVLSAVNRVELATVRAIHKQTGFDKATIVRMLETLIHAGYVTHEAEAGGYRVTGRVLLLSAGFDRYESSAGLSAPILARFRNVIGWPSDLAICDGDAMIVVRTSREPGPLFFNRHAGYRAPILKTSLGKAYLAHCSSVERSSILDQLRASSSNEAVPDPSTLEAMLSRVQADGFATMDDGYSQSEYGGTLWAIAVPVIGGDRLYGSINIMMLRQAVTTQMARETYLPELKQAAAELAAAFHAGGL